MFVVLPCSDWLRDWVYPSRYLAEWKAAMKVELCIWYSNPWASVFEWLSHVFEPLLMEISSKQTKRGSYKSSKSCSVVCRSTHRVSHSGFILVFEVWEFPDSVFTPLSWMGEDSSLVSLLCPSSLSTISSLSSSVSSPASDSVSSFKLQCPFESCSAATHQLPPPRSSALRWKFEEKKSCWL